MNALAILRGTFGNFGPLSLTTSTCVNVHRDLYHYLERALSPTCKHYNVNEHPRNPSGYFSVTFDHYHWLLRLASRHLPRYRQLANIVMLMNTLAILRGTFGNFRPLSLTTTTCVNLHRDLPLTFDHYHWLLRFALRHLPRYRQLVNIVMLMNTLAIFRGYFW